MAHLLRQRGRNELDTLAVTDHHIVQVKPLIGIDMRV
jgi:hypothetical protein